MNEIMTLVSKAHAIAGSKRKLAKELYVSYNAVMMWSKGYLPKVENIKKLEEYIAGKT